jgi:Flp pilus assembly protein TadD/4-amino-4-deoxy-L-arabinose transferase-like glycosyltransferase
MMTRLTLPLLLAVCFVIKLVVLFQLHDHPLLQPHGEMDTAYYVELGRRVAQQGVLGVTEPFFVSPLYVYFLALVFAGGGGLLAAKLLQVALGTAAVGLLFATTRSCFGPRAAVWAGLLAILTGLFTFYEVLILQAALDPFLVAGALYAVSRATDVTGTGPGDQNPEPRGRPAWLIGAGVAIGLLVLNRPNALVYAPVAGVLAAAAGWRSGARPGPGRVLAGATLFGVGFAAVLGLNAARNVAVSGQAVAIASHGGLNFYIGNHAGADGTYSPVPGIRPSIAGQATDSERVAEASLGRPLSPSEVSSYFYGLGWQWVRENPGPSARLFLRKIGILLNGTNVPLNYSYAYYSREEPSLLRWLAVGPWLLIPAGVVGLCWPSLRRRSAGYWAWGTFVPLYGLSVAAFFVSSRYRMPLLVPLCATAGAALAGAVELLRAGRLRTLAAPAAAALLLAIPVGLDLRLDDGAGGEQTRRAVWLIEGGSFEEASAYALRIAPGHSHPGVLAYRLGLAYLDAGRPAEALEWLQRAQAHDGSRPAILLALGKALLAAGRPGDAAKPLATAYRAGWEVGESAPLLVRALVMAGRGAEAAQWVSSIPETAADGPDVPLDLGTVALEQGAPAAAVRWLRLAVSRAPANAEASEKLGVALFLQDLPGEAAPHLERACRLDPSSASAHLNLAAVYAQLGRVAQARQHAREAARLDPAEPRAAALLQALAGRR